MKIKHEVVAMMSGAQGIGRCLTQELRRRVFGWQQPIFDMKNTFKMVELTLK